MAKFTVTTAADVVSGTDGMLSLREAVAQANATTVADTIVFAADIEGQRLVLTRGELTIEQDLSIDGDSNNDGAGVTIDGNHASRIMSVSRGNFDTIVSDLAFVNGSTLDADYGYRSGAAIRSYGSSLNIDNCLFMSNNADEYSGSGGAVFVSGGTLTVSSSIFSENVGLGGGAIGTGSGGIDALIQDSVFQYNRAVVGGALEIDGNLKLESSIIKGNIAYQYHSGGGGGISLYGSGTISGCSIIYNSSLYNGGGIDFFGDTLTISNSTIAGNLAFPNYSRGHGGGIDVHGLLVVRNSTITGNVARGGYYEPAAGGGIYLHAAGLGFPGGYLDIANTIVAGNSAGPAYYDGTPGSGSDIAGPIILSNGHNIFGSDVLGNVSGDLENVAAVTLFADIAGLVNADGIVPLRANVANPAISGADRLLAMTIDQLGDPRPVPSESNADIGAAESGFAPSKVASAGNDVLTGTTAANVIKGLGGHDFMKGLAGNDTLNGNDGGDFLTGGLGNDKLNGGNGIDLVNYADLATAVTVDLRGDTATDTDTARRGTETDTLTGIEGAVGSGKADIFFGDSQGNWFQGGSGKDTYTGGAGRDLYDFNLTSAAGLGTSRDVIKDFAHLSDKIDLAGIDADSTVAGNQALRWVGSAALTGAGEVGYYTADGNTIIRMSTDADATSEGEIQLSGIRTLTAVDFYL